MGLIWFGWFVGIVFYFLFDDVGLGLFGSWIGVQVWIWLMMFI